MTNTNTKGKHEERRDFLNELANKDITGMSLSELKAHLAELEKYHLARSVKSPVVERIKSLEAGLVGEGSRPTQGQRAPSSFEALRASVAETAAQAEPLPPTQPKQSAPAPESQPAEKKQGPVVKSLAAYLAIKFPQKHPLLGMEPRRSPLRSLEVMMIYAYRGTGKTRFANFLAVCLAGGKQFLKWPIGKEGIRVLYIDGELDGEEQQERWPQAIKAAGADFETVSRNLFVMNRYIQEREVIPPFNTPEGKRFLVEASKGFDVVIIDSMLAFFPRGNRDWDKAAELMNTTLELNRDTNGCAQVLIHHENKSGFQDGSVHNERLVSVSWRLKEIQDDTPLEGSHIELSFEKKRNLFGPDVETLDIKYMNDSWTWAPAEGSQKERACEMARNGMKQKDIAAAVGKSQSWVVGVLKAAGISTKDYR